MAAVLTVSTLTGCSGGSAGGGVPQTTEAARVVKAEGTFSAPPGNIVTYEALVPVGASGTVDANEPPPPPA